MKRKKTKEERKRLESEGEVKGEGRSQMRNTGNRGGKRWMEMSVEGWRIWTVEGGYELEKDRQKFERKK